MISCEQFGDELIPRIAFLACSILCLIYISKTVCQNEFGEKLFRKVANPQLSDQS